MKTARARVHFGTVLVIALSGALLGAPCQGDDSAVASQPEEGPGCPGWTIDVDSARPDGATASAIEDDGALLLTVEGDGEGACASPVEPCGAITVYQSGLRGDFDVTAEVESLEGAGAFAGVSLFVTPVSSSSTTYAEASIWGETGAIPNLSAAFVGLSNSQEAKGVDATHATLRLRRVGSQVTITGEAGGYTLEKSSFHSSSDQVVGFVLEDASTTGRVTARITRFTVHGGGGDVIGSEFDCGGLVAPPPPRGYPAPTLGT